MTDRKVEGSVTIGTEIAVMWPQAKEYQQRPEAEARSGFSEPLEGA